MYKYKIVIYGYGGEVVWSKLTEKQYNYWKENEENLSNHILYHESDNIPDYAILDDNGDKEYYDCDDIEHEYYLSLENATINIECIKDGIIIVDNKNLESFIEKNDIQQEYLENNGIKNVDYGLQIYSCEKGVFFDFELELESKFDIKKLKFVFQEANNEIENKVVSIIYDDVVYEDMDSCTTGKSIDFYLIKYI